MAVTVVVGGHLLQKKHNIFLNNEILYIEQQSTN